MTPFWISAAGGVGAVARFVADGLIRTVLGRKFPWGTLLINISGSFLLGLLTGLVLYRHGSVNMRLILGTGFCGGFTTFSTASFEAARPIEEKRFVVAVAQVLGNFGLALLAAALGLPLFKP
ncbi:MAG TPA: fluoride efflux transporter CrcB [Candidatus Saccharimonadales bacterium]|jgi:CrcB protein